MTSATANTRSGTTNIAVSDHKQGPREILRLSRLARELRLTDQILSEDLDTVNVVDSGPAPAWTSLDGDQVTFSAAHMPPPKDRLSVAVWLGTNAHELGHVLFSPRRHSTLMRRVMESDKFFMEGLMQLWNAAEDQRQERLLLARFAPWKGYLAAALGHHLVADNESAWLLMAGRTWLSQTVRDEAQARFVAARGQALADEVTSLIGDYQRLLDPGESEQDAAWDVLKRLHDIFADAPPKMPRPCTVMDGGEPDTQPGRGSPPPTADEVPPPDEGDDADAVPGDGDGADSDADPEDGDGDGDADGDGRPGGRQRTGVRRSEWSRCRSRCRNATTV